MVCARTSFGNMSSILGANHGGELSLIPVGYFLMRGMDETRRQWYIVVADRMGAVSGQEMANFT